MRISDWSSDVCSSDLQTHSDRNDRRTGHAGRNGGPSLPINRRAVSVRSFPLTALFCIAVLASLYVARDVFVPLVLACFLYLVLSPILRGLERLYVPTALGSATIVLALVAILGYGLYVLAAPVGEWMGRFPEMLSEARYKIERSEEHTSELPSLMRISYAVFCLKKKK